VKSNEQSLQIQNISERGTRILFAKTFDCARFIYNKMPADKIEYYNRNKKLNKKLNNTPAQYKTEFE